MPPWNRTSSSRTSSSRSKPPRQRRAHRISTDQRPLVPDVLSADSVPVARLGAATIFPGLFRKRIQSVPPEVEPGDLVAVDVAGGERLGYGFYNPASELSVRMASWGDQLPDSEHWDRLIDDAVTLREQLCPEDAAAACRLIHAEGDRIPGIVVDRFGDVLSAEAFSLAMFQRGRELLERLAERCGTKHWLMRTSPQSEDQEGFDAAPLTSGNVPDGVTIIEHGVRYRIRFEGGHKTGFFCDQRDNRKKLAELCRGKSVADLCCYTGGFAVQAKTLGQAEEVVGVDIDEEPLRLARENAKLNQVPIRFVQGDVFPWMRDMVRNGKQFDVVVLDPSKLIRSRAEFEEGRRAHFDLNRLAMQLVKPGGLMLTCTCAGLLSREEFDKLVCAAARQAGDPAPGAENDGFSQRLPRDVQIIDRTGAGIDHPIAGNCPESDYLKATWVRLL